MSPVIALAISIAILGGVDTYITATAFPLPIWAAFIAWASFFTCGARSAGFAKSIISALTGLLIASLGLLAISFGPQAPVAAAMSVGMGSGVIILASSHRALDYPPAIVFGFASTVGTAAAGRHGIIEVTLMNPALISAISLLVGTAFGFMPERVVAIFAARRGIA